MPPTHIITAAIMFPVCENNSFSRMFVHPNIKVSYTVTQSLFFTKQTHRGSIFHLTSLWAHHRLWFHHSRHFTLPQDWICYVIIFAGKNHHPGTEIQPLWLWNCSLTQLHILLPLFKPFSIQNTSKAWTTTAIRPDCEAEMLWNFSRKG